MLKGSCPVCNKSLEPIKEIVSCEIECGGCGFKGGFGARKAESPLREDLTEQEYNMLLALAAHGGKVICLLAAIKGIPSRKTRGIVQDPRFDRTEYLHLRNYFNALAAKAKNLLKGKKLDLVNILKSASQPDADSLEEEEMEGEDS